MGEAPARYPPLCFGFSKRNMCLMPIRFASGLPSGNGSTPLRCTPGPSKRKVSDLPRFARTELCDVFYRTG